LTFTTRRKKAPLNTNNPLFGRAQLHHFSITNLIQWGDHLSVGHSGIDAQHKAIFELGGKIYEHWRDGASVGVLRPTVDKLEHLLRAHFSYEERLLGEIAYEGRDHHAAEHRSMLKDMEFMQGRFNAFKDGEKSSGGSLLAPGWPVMQFVLEFSIGHVSTSDMSYCQALIASRNPGQRTT
jgi:hemerythrin-like metal-binding protein